jgi:hypothetical protein
MVDCVQFVVEALNAGHARAAEDRSWDALSTVASGDGGPPGRPARIIEVSTEQKAPPWKLLQSRYLAVSMSFRTGDPFPVLPASGGAGLFFGRTVQQRPAASSAPAERPMGGGLGRIPALL